MVTLYTLFMYLAALSAVSIALYDAGGRTLAKRTWAIAYCYGKHSGLIDVGTDHCSYTEVV